MRTKLTVSVFIIMLAAFLVIILLPADLQSVKNENREAQALPEISFNNIFFGDFCMNFETYLSDNVGYRGKLINASNFLDGLKGIKSYGYISNVNGDLGMGNADVNKGLLITDGKIMEIFKKSPEMAKEYASMVNHYAKKLPENIKIYNMIIPTQIEFEDKKYSSLADSQKETIDEIYAALDEKVVKVDAYSQLLQHKDEYIYFRTDHHWTTLGAYYAYKQFAKDAGIDSVDIKDFQEKKAEGFLGYLYNQAQATELKDKPDTIYYYTNGDNLVTYARAWENGETIEYKGRIFVPPMPGQETKYSLFLGGDHPLLDIPTNADNDRVILVIKDSYANAFLPWLTNSFGRIVVADPRSFGTDISQVIEEFSVTDVLLMNYSFSTTFADIISSEKGIYN